MQCPDIFNSTSGTAAASPYLANTAYAFTCNANYALPPTGTATSMTYFCNGTGSWNATFVDCLRK